MRPLPESDYMSPLDWGTESLISEFPVNNAIQPTPISLISSWLLQEERYLVNEIDDIVRESLVEFVEDVFSSSWWGKEREAVSLFSFGYLVKRCRKGSVLYDPAQIGIEVRVPKPDSFGLKREVCKDMVIWPAPGMTCWDENNKPTRQPLSVLEWKVHAPGVSARDLEWLRAFSVRRPDFIGYALCLNLDGKDFRLRCARIQNEIQNTNWLEL